MKQQAVVSQNNNADFSADPQHIYHIENFQTFNGDQRNTQSSQNNRAADQANGRIYMDSEKDNAGDFQVYIDDDQPKARGKIVPNTRPPPTSLNSDMIHQQDAVNHNRLMAASNAAAHHNNHTGFGSNQNESSIMRNFYSHKTRITKQTHQSSHQSQDYPENYQDFQLSHQTEEEQESVQENSYSEQSSQKHRKVDMTEYDSLIPFGTADSANKIADMNLDSSNNIIR